MRDLIDEEVTLRKAESQARDRLLADFAEAGKKARRRGQHVLCRGRLVQFETWEGEQRGVRRLGAFGLAKPTSTFCNWARSQKRHVGEATPVALKRSSSCSSGSMEFEGTSTVSGGRR